jgi:hypothetical protein
MKVDRGASLHSQQAIEYLPADWRLLIARARLEPKQQRALIPAHLGDGSRRLASHGDRRIGEPVHEHPQNHLAPDVRARDQPEHADAA